MDILFSPDDRELKEFKDSAKSIGFDDLAAECAANAHLLQPHDRLQVLLIAWKKIGDFLTQNQYTPCVGLIMKLVGRYTLDLWFGRDWISCSIESKTYLIEHMMKVYPAAYITLQPYSWPYMFSIYRDPWMVDYLNQNFQRMHGLDAAERLEARDLEFIQQEGISLIVFRIINMFEFQMYKLVKHMCVRILLAWQDATSTASRAMQATPNSVYYIDFVRHIFLMCLYEFDGEKELHYALEYIQRNMRCDTIETSRALERIAQIIANGIMESNRTLLEFLNEFLLKTPEEFANTSFGCAIKRYVSFLTVYQLRKINSMNSIFIAQIPDNVHERLLEMFIIQRESSEEMMKTIAMVSERLFSRVRNLRALKFAYDKLKNRTRSEWYSTKITLVLAIISDELNSLEEYKYIEGKTAEELLKKEQELAIHYRDLAKLLTRIPYLEQEVWLTAFSLHPCKEYSDAVTKCGSRNLRAIKKQSLKFIEFRERNTLKKPEENNQIIAKEEEEDENDEDEDEGMKDGESGEKKDSEQSKAPEVEKYFNEEEDQKDPEEKDTDITARQPQPELESVAEKRDLPSPGTALPEVVQPDAASADEDEAVKAANLPKKLLNKKGRSKKSSKGIINPPGRGRPGPKSKVKTNEKKSLKEPKVLNKKPPTIKSEPKDKDSAEVIFAAAAGAADNITSQTVEDLKYPAFALITCVIDTDDLVKYTNYQNASFHQYNELNRLLSHLRLQYSDFNDVLALLISPRYKRLSWAICWKTLKKRCRELLTKDKKKFQLAQQCMADANERLQYLHIDYEKYKDKPQLDYGTIEQGYECFDTESGDDMLKPVIADPSVSNRTPTKKADTLFGALKRVKGGSKELQRKPTKRPLKVKSPVSETIKSPRRKSKKGEKQNSDEEDECDEEIEANVNLITDDEDAFNVPPHKRSVLSHIQNQISQVNQFASRPPTLSSPIYLDRPIYIVRRASSDPNDSSHPILRRSSTLEVGTQRSGAAGVISTQIIYSPQTAIQYESAVTFPINSNYIQSPSNITKNTNTFEPIGPLNKSPPRPSPLSEDTLTSDSFHGNWETTSEDIKSTSLLQIGKTCFTFYNLDQRIMDSPTFGRPTEYIPSDNNQQQGLIVTKSREQQLVLPNFGQQNKVEQSHPSAVVHTPERLGKKSLKISSPQSKLRNLVPKAAHQSSKSLPTENVAVSTVRRSRHQQQFDPNEDNNTNWSTASESFNSDDDEQPEDLTMPKASKTAPRKRRTRGPLSVPLSVPLNLTSKKLEDTRLSVSAIAEEQRGDEEDESLDLMEEEYLDEPEPEEYLEEPDPEDDIIEELDNSEKNEELERQEESVEPWRPEEFEEKDENQQPVECKEEEEHDEVPYIQESEAEDCEEGDYKQKEKHPYEQQQEANVPKSKTAFMQSACDTNISSIQQHHSETEKIKHERVYTGREINVPYEQPAVHNSKMESISPPGFVASTGEETRCGTQRQYPELKFEGSYNNQPFAQHPNLSEISKLIPRDSEGKIRPHLHIRPGPAEIYSSDTNTIRHIPMKQVIIPCEGPVEECAKAGSIIQLPLRSQNRPPPMPAVGNAILPTMTNTLPCAEPNPSSWPQPVDRSPNHQTIEKVQVSNPPGSAPAYRPPVPNQTFYRTVAAETSDLALATTQTPATMSVPNQTFVPSAKPHVVPNSPAPVGVPCQILFPTSTLHQTDLPNQVFIRLALPNPSTASARNRLQAGTTGQNSNQTIIGVGVLTQNSSGLSPTIRTTKQNVANNHVLFNLSPPSEFHDEVADPAHRPTVRPLPQISNQLPAPGQSCSNQSYNQEQTIGALQNCRQATADISSQIQGNQSVQRPPHLPVAMQTSHHLPTSTFCQGPMSASPQTSHQTQARCHEVSALGQISNQAAAEMLAQASCQQQSESPQTLQQSYTQHWVAPSRISYQTTAMMYPQIKQQGVPIKGTNALSQISSQTQVLVPNPNQSLAGQTFNQLVPKHAIQMPCSQDAASSAKLGTTEENLNFKLPKAILPQQAFLTPPVPGGQQTSTAMNNILNTPCEELEALGIVLENDLSSENLGDDDFVDEVNNFIVTELLSNATRAMLSSSLSILRPASICVYEGASMMVVVKSAMPPSSIPLNGTEPLVLRSGNKYFEVSSREMRRKPSCKDPFSPKYITKFLRCDRPPRAKLSNDPESDLVTAVRKLIIVYISILRKQKRLRQKKSRANKEKVSKRHQHTTRALANTTSNVVSVATQSPVMDEQTLSEFTVATGALKSNLGPRSSADPRKVPTLVARLVNAPAGSRKSPTVSAVHDLLNAPAVEAERNSPTATEACNELEKSIKCKKIARRVKTPTNTATPPSIRVTKPTPDIESHQAQDINLPIGTMSREMPRFFKTATTSSDSNTKPKASPFLQTDTVNALQNISITTPVEVQSAQVSHLSPSAQSNASVPKKVSIVGTVLKSPTGTILQGKLAMAMPFGTDASTRNIIITADQRTAFLKRGAERTAIDNGTEKIYLISQDKPIVPLSQGKKGITPTTTQTHTDCNLQQMLPTQAPHLVNVSQKNNPTTVQVARDSHRNLPTAQVTYSTLKSVLTTDQATIVVQKNLSSATVQAGNGLQTSTPRTVAQVVQAVSKSVYAEASTALQRTLPTGIQAGNSSQTSTPRPFTQVVQGVLQSVLTTAEANTVLQKTLPAVIISKPTFRVTSAVPKSVLTTAKETTVIQNIPAPPAAVPTTTPNPTAVPKTVSITAGPSTVIQKTIPAGVHSDNAQQTSTPKTAAQLAHAVSKSVSITAASATVLQDTLPEAVHADDDLQKRSPTPTGEAEFLQQSAPTAVQASTAFQKKVSQHLIN